MADWTREELDAIDSAREIGISVLRPDGTPRRYVTIWIIRVGDMPYVRSWRGQAGAWYRAALRRPEGRVRVGGLERAVTLERPADADSDAIDAAYRDKYGRDGAAYVDAMVAPEARETTLRVRPV